MSEEFVIVEKEDLTAIADAVRESTGSTEEFNVSELRTAAVVALSAGGGGGTAVLDAAKEYTDNKVAELINGAPTTMDTLKEVADAMAENASVVEALDSAIGSKADANTVNTHISNKSNPHGVTAAQVGAAPSGYGLGSVAANKYVPKLSDLTAIGWFVYAHNIEENPKPGYAGVISVTASSLGTRQDAYVIGYYGMQHLTRHNITDNGLFSEWEWVNPPMSLGVEYRTTERWNGEAVYSKLINFGAMPNASEKIIGHGVSGMKQPLSVSVTAYKSNWAFTLPSSHTNEASVLLNTNGVQITTTIDRSEYTAYALIKYTKN